MAPEIEAGGGEILQVTAAFDDEAAKPEGVLKTW